VKELVGYARILMGLSAATSTDWVGVKNCLETVKSSDPPPGFLDNLTLYLFGVFQQGVGNLDAALEIWSHRKFRLDSIQTSTSQISSVHLDLSILATLNRIWVLSDPQHRDDAKIGELLDLLKPLCEDSLDMERRMAYDLVAASIQPRTSVTKIKNHIQKALTVAQGMGNSHFLSMALNLMRDRIFNGVVGEQALKSAKAALAQAKKSTNLLWMSAAEGMFADSLEKQGSMRSEVRDARAVGKAYAEQLWERTLAAIQQ
jgi:hypothetical protein